MVICCRIPNKNWDFSFSLDGLGDCSEAEGSRCACREAWIADCCALCCAVEDLGCDGVVAERGRLECHRKAGVHLPVNYLGWEESYYLGRQFEVDSVSVDDMEDDVDCLGYVAVVDHCCVKCLVVLGELVLLELCPSSIQGEAGVRTRRWLGDSYCCGCRALVAAVVGDVKRYGECSRARVGVRYRCAASCGSVAEVPGPGDYCAVGVIARGPIEGD